MCDISGKIKGMNLRVVMVRCSNLSIYYLMMNENLILVVQLRIYVLLIRTGKL